MSQGVDCCLSVWNSISNESSNNVLTDDFIMKYDKYMNFTTLSSQYNFSELLMRIYFHRIVWESLTSHQQLSEPILEEFSTLFDFETWGAVAKHQQLSEQFIKNHLHDLDINLILKYHHNISDEFKFNLTSLTSIIGHKCAAVDLNEFSHNGAAVTNNTSLDKSLLRLLLYWVFLLFTVGVGWRRRG